MGGLWKVEGQHEWFRSCVFDFNTTICKCGLRDESYLRIHLAKDHIVVILNIKFSNTPTSTVRVEQCRALWAKICLTARLDREPKDRAFLIAKEISINDPLCINTVAFEFFGRNSWT